MHLKNTSKITDVNRLEPSLFLCLITTYHSLVVYSDSIADPCLSVCPSIFINPHSLNIH